MCAILHNTETEEFNSPLSYHYNISALCGNETVHCKLQLYIKDKVLISRLVPTLHCTALFDRIHFTPCPPYTPPPGAAANNFGDV